MSTVHEPGRIADQADRPAAGGRIRAIGEDIAKLARADGDLRLDIASRFIRRVRGASVSEVTLGETPASSKWPIIDVRALDIGKPPDEQRSMR